MAYDPAATRERILTSALQEFAAYGLAGARVDRIALNARANKESIYRYFGNKEQLLDRVLSEYLRTNGDGVSPQADKLDKYVAELFRHHRAHPEFLRLCLWEGLERSDGLTPEALRVRQGHYDDKLAAIRAAQADGSVDPALDPRHLLVVLLGMVNYWFAVPQIVRLVFGEAPDDELFTRHEEFLHECYRRLTAVPGQPDESP
ncbi:TetR family transcriptional regulator [Streptomyces sp. TRM68367]|uniref:TetR family transcriptional regulator n=1 Tax=Streptomyces sp. TRM68367 TaxID=2758415 RepID=UPI00165A76DA|nr:TetR family transcriptional regulator [Streptomyces sp. TRM68367]MBC9725827.1 TetR/AcrR family transcriptional regulator [Streptomyces sp. TRM68367]